MSELKAFALFLWQERRDEKGKAALRVATLRRFDAQALDTLEVSAVVGKQCEVILKRRCTDQQIHITDQRTRSAKTAFQDNRRNFWR